MNEQSLTLRQIENNLRELIQYREALLENSFAMEEAERGETLRLTEEQIVLNVKRELKKADGVAFNLLEFRRHVGKCSDRDWKEPGAIDLEIDRLKKLKAQYLNRYDYLEEVAIRALQFIEQTEGRKSIDGELSTLALRKNPPSVEIAQEALVPAEYRRTTITLDQQTWEFLIAGFERAGQIDAAEVIKMALISSSCKTEPKKAEIAKQLKQSDPCPKCKGAGNLEHVSMDEGGHISTTYEECEQCGGSGSIPRGVPGCVLKSGYRLEVR